MQIHKSDLRLVSTHASYAPGWNELIARPPRPPMQIHMSELRGRATLIVNVASHCGYTDSNYKALKEVYDRYSAYGLEVGGTGWHGI